MSGYPSTVTITSTLKDLESSDKLDAPPVPPLPKLEFELERIAPASEETFPEGGLRAWLTVAGGYFLAVGKFVSHSTSGSMQSFGVYQDYYTRISLNEHPPSEISWIGSVQIFFLFSGGVISGKLFDKGYFRELLIGGCIIYLASSFLLSLAQPHHYYQNFLAQGVGMGIGMGILFLPCISAAAHYFKRRRGLAMGVMISGSSIGAIVYPIMINHLFNGENGTRFPGRTKASAEKIDFGVILRDIPFWIFTAGIFLTYWGLFVPTFYLQLFAVEHHASQTLQTYSLAIMNAAGFVGRTIPMYYADILGLFNVLIPMTIISGGLAFAFLGATSNAGLIVFAILYGFFSGGVVSTAAPASASFSRNVGEIGTRMGTINFITSFSMLTGNPISGAILHPPEYTWVPPIVFSGVTVLAGAFLLSISYYMQRQKR
ncbi:MFS general substrate transporter [Favolaschia claudopus]|uniref:MFS general substrate transporter n=1 Tax=Favolaschia claudopus TaxID=2862362 RepID=A0AAW0E2S0_9AGAR